MASFFLLKLICCLAAVTLAATLPAQDKNFSQKQDKKMGKPQGNIATAKVSSQIKVTRDISSSVSSPSVSPTKFGFVPTRTASSYAAKSPRPSYFQHSYNVKEKREPSVASGYQISQYDNQPRLQEPPQYASQELSSHQVQSVPYLQPELYSQYQSQPAQQYQSPEVSIQYAHQPTVARSHQQFETVQYVTDNNIGQSGGQDHYEDSSKIAVGGDNVPQYYYVQGNYEEPSGNGNEGFVDPKSGVQYVYSYEPTNLASTGYSLNGLSSDSKYQRLQEYQIPVTSSKYSSTLPKIQYTTGKYLSSKPSAYEKAPKYHFTTSTYQKPSSFEKNPHQEYQYVSTPSKIPSTYEKAPAPVDQPSYQNYQTYQGDYHQQQEVIIHRHPKSLLDSYIPSVVQLRWLEQQKYSKKYQH